MGLKPLATQYIRSRCLEASIHRTREFAVELILAKCKPEVTLHLFMCKLSLQLVQHVSLFLITFTSWLSSVYINMANDGTYILVP